MTTEIEFAPARYNLSGWHNEAASEAFANASSNSPIGAVREAEIVKDGDWVIVRLEDLFQGTETAIVNAFTGRLADLEHVETREV